VLLLDEIEKADKEVYNIFLQVLDEGFLTDNSGCKVDFSNVIVLFTSNVGAKKASAFGGGIGFNTDADKNAKSIMTKELKNQFPPEFLNRLDNIIYFNSLTKENLKDIIRIELNKLVKNVSEIGYKYEYTDKTVDFIYDKVSEELEYGARPIRRAIQENIEDKITDEILENESLERGHVFKLESQY
jgi:ATP-dependent Clp protease ATP-binding subunit ClpC